MCKIFLSLAISLFCLKSTAQNNFEGEITYKMSFSREKDNTVLHVLFGDQKIKVLVEPPTGKANDKEDLILDFKNGIFYKIINDTKTYTVDSFKKTKNDIIKSAKSLVPLAEQDTTFAGYKSLAYTIAAGEKPEFENTKTTFWYADSLVYKIPEKYVPFEMIPLFTNGSSVGMGMKLVMQLEQNKSDSFQFKILKLESKKIPDSLLGLPAGYTVASAKSILDENEQMADLVATPDTIASPTTPIKKEIKDAGNPGKENAPSSKNRKVNKQKIPAKKRGN